MSSTIVQVPGISADDWDVGAAFNGASTSVSVGRNASTNQKYGLRFPSVPIPVGATITSAVLTFTCQQTRADTPTVRIYANAADNPAAPTNLAQEAALVRSTASVDWTIPATTINVPFNSPDLSAPIQEVVNRAGWAFGNALILLVDNLATDATRLTSFYTRDNNSGLAQPYLTLTWSHPSKDMASVTVAASGDDVACPTTTNTFDSSSATIIFGRSTVVSKCLFRFANTQVAKNATIESARVVFRQSATISLAPTLSVKGAAADNVSAPADQTAADAIARTSASVAWSTGGGGAAGTLLRTPDITSVVQEIVNRSGWAAGNAMGIFVECTSPSGSPSATVYTKDGDASFGQAAPRLEIVYTVTNTGLRHRNRLLLDIG